MGSKNSSKFLPNDMWHGRGVFPSLLVASSVFYAHLQKLRDKGKIDYLRLAAEPSMDRFTAEVQWTTEEGAHIYAHLVLVPLVQAGTVGAAIDGHAAQWTLTARADCSWNYLWPSPISTIMPSYEILEWRVPYKGSDFRYNARRPFSNEVMGNWGFFRSAVKQLRRIPAISVFAHYEEGDVSILPPILDIPVLPGLDGKTIAGVFTEREAWEKANQALRAVKLSIPKGGAMILSNEPKRMGVRSADLIVTREQLAEDPEALQEALDRYAHAPEAMDRLTERCVDELLVAQATPSLDVQVADLERRTENLQDRARKAELLEAEARSEAESERKKSQELREELERVRCMTDESELEEIAVYALQDRDDAQLFAELLGEELDLKVREVERLRRQLYQAGQVPNQEPASHDSVSSWEELVSLAGELMPHLWLADVVETAAPLVGSSSEPTWLQRSLEAFQALEDYAEAKTKAQAEGHVPTDLANFQLYLRSGRPGSMIPAARYAARESETVRYSEKWGSLRIFSVPPEVVPAGKVLMDAHIKIGSGGFHAPRMHFFDDTDKSGLVCIGYIGPHLSGPMDKGI